MGTASGIDNSDFRMIPLSAMPVVDSVRDGGLPRSLARLAAARRGDTTERRTAHELVRG